jgi:hypothetical protein
MLPGRIECDGARLIDTLAAERGDQRRIPARIDLGDKDIRQRNGSGVAISRLPAT